MDSELIKEVKTDDADIAIDFSEKEGLPLFKKLNAMICGWLGEEKLTRCSGMIAEMSADNVRIDITPAAYGIWNKAEGTDYTPFLNMIRAYYDKNCLPYLCYFPLPWAVTGEKTTDPPASYDGWRDYCRDMASTLRSNGITLAAHEIWNEPDLHYAFTGKFEDYLKMYSYASEGIIDANPDAVIGGLSVGELDRVNDRGEVRAFIEYCINNMLPLDFISYHAYNRVNDTYGQDPVKYTMLMRSILDEYKLPDVRIHLNEYNISQDKATQKYSAPAQAIDNLVRLNEMTDIEQINWAHFYDIGNTVGLVNTDFQPLALYNALTFYNNMPFDRRRVINASDVSCVASSDSHRACAILYNISDSEKEFTLKLGNVPFEYGNLTVYCITEEHSAYESKESEFYTGYKKENLRLKDAVLLLKIEKGASFYISLDDRSGINEVGNAVKIGDFVRKDYHYYSREKTCYAEYDRSSQTLLMGMGGSDSATAETSAVYDSTADIIKVKRELEGGGKGECGMQIAFHTPDGYTKAVYYPIAGEKAPQFSRIETTSVSDALGDETVIDIKENAPDGFDGRTRISFMIKDMPADASVKLRLTR